jgi:hypothetical protein
VPAVEVGHDRNRAAVGRLVASVAVTPVRPAGRVRPVERLVHRQQVREEVAVPVDEAVDPLDSYRPAPVGLDRERRVVEGAQVARRAVAPDRGLPETRARWQDLLLELAHGDLVVVDPRPARRR